jgi:hypothetical protein
VRRRQTVPVDADPRSDGDPRQGSSIRLIPVDELRDEERLQEEMALANERNRALSRLMNELQARHWETWLDVKQAVDATDPEGLLGLGSTEDEYDDVVVHLVGRVLRDPDVTAQALTTWFLDRYGCEANHAAVADLVGAVSAVQARVLGNA